MSSAGFPFFFLTLLQVTELSGCSSPQLCTHALFLQWCRNVAWNRLSARPQRFLVFMSHPAQFGSALWTRGGRLWSHDFWTFSFKIWIKLKLLFCVWSQWKFDLFVQLHWWKFPVVVFKSREKPQNEKHQTSREETARGNNPPRSRLKTCCCEEQVFHGWDSLFFILTRMCVCMFVGHFLLPFLALNGETQSSAENKSSCALQATGHRTPASDKQAQTRDTTFKTKSTIFCPTV